MFDGKKYITRGISENIPLEIQIILWDMVLSMPVKKDYLQIFELSTNENILTVKHSQEVPPYEKIYKFIVLETINEKIYIIDDGDYSTMLLADEY